MFDLVLLQTVTSRITDAALQIAIPVVTAVVLWLVHRLVRVFEAKTNIQVPAQTQAMIDDWVQKGVAYAEQKAAKAAMAKAATIKGPEKLEAAVGFVLDLADQHGYTALARDKIEKLVESELGINKVS